MSRTLTLADLERHEISIVEPRETLNYFNWANITATNVALAVNTATLNSSASAWAGQTIYVG